MNEITPSPSANEGISEQTSGSKETSGSKPAAAVFFDGLTNRRHDVELRLASGLEVRADDRLLATWDFDALRRMDSRSGTLRLSCEGAPPLARLEVRDADVAAAIAARASNLDVGHPSRSNLGRIIGWSLAAVASIVAVAVYGVPLIAERLTPLIPARFEQRIGDVAENQIRFVFEGKTCDRPAGQAAFTKLVDQLRNAGGLSPGVKASVISNDIANAIALPGGKIYLFNGLLKKAENVDEIAGVLAHELGHVHHRDHLRTLIHNGGTSFLLGLLFGDITGSGAMIFASRTLFNASFSREAETDADRFAIDVMTRLGRSPRPMGELLFRVTGKQGGKNIGIIASHPLTEDRLARMKESEGTVTGAPLLNAAEWEALKEVCNTDK